MTDVIMMSIDPDEYRELIECQLNANNELPQLRRKVANMEDNNAFLTQMIYKTLGELDSSVGNSDAELRETANKLIQDLKFIMNRYSLSYFQEYAKYKGLD